jgi:IS30 family transposase
VAALTEEKIDMAVGLYAQGRSTADIGSKLGADPSTIARALKRRGVVLRSRGQQARSTS